MSQSDQQHYARSFELYNGMTIPSIGLGTWQMEDETEVRRTVRASLLQFGYKHIDTASIYRNERFIGAELAEISKEIAPMPINSCFLTSKVPPTKTQSFDSVIQCFEQSCRDLGTDCIDLYLIHWPGTSKVDVESEKNAELRLQTWLALEKLYRDKRVKAIGVSNFMPNHLSPEFLSQVSVVPMLNSIEYHPLVWKCEQYLEVERICRENKIAMQAYSPLVQGELFSDELPHYKHLCDGLNVSDKTILSQKILQWALHHGKCVIPKSTNLGHLKSNIEALDAPVLSQQEVEVIDELYCNRRICWNPLLIA